MKSSILQRGQRSGRRPVGGLKPRCRPQTAVRTVAVYASQQGNNLYSELVDQSLLLYIFQQDLGVQLQRALNQEQFEIANQIRAKREQVGT